MIVCFARHGKAEEKKPGQSDEERKLTPEGREDVELVARAIPVSNFVKIYTSPLTRARETAEIIARIKGGEVVVLDELAPQRASIEALSSIELEGDSVFVGHAPSIEDMVEAVIGGGKVKLKAGAIACIDIGDSKRLARSVGVLIALIPPSAARPLLSANR